MDMPKKILAPASLRERLAAPRSAARSEVMVPVAVATMVALTAPAAAQSAPTELPALTVEAEKEVRAKARPKPSTPRRAPAAPDRKSTRLNSSHRLTSRMPSSA
jgi:hypothetical protein